MLDPISARFASSCSKNGIKAVAAEIIWTVETAISSASTDGTSTNSCLYLTATDLLTIRLELSSFVSPGAIFKLSSSSAVR